MENVIPNNITNPYTEQLSNLGVTQIQLWLGESSNSSFAAEETLDVTWEFGFNLTICEIFCMSQ